MAWYKDKFFWAIVSVATLIKASLLAYLFFKGPLGEQVLVFPDSLGYVYPAQTLLAYGHLWEAVSTAPMLLRTPGYPVFLSAIQLFTGNMTWAVAVVQNILSLGMLLPVYLTARRLGGLTAARWAAGCCAASVLYFSLAFAVLTETVCAFLLAWFVFLILRWLDAPRTRDLLASAFLLGAATYVRPVVYYFIPVMFGLGLFWAWKQQSRALLRQFVLAFALPLVICVGTWQIRNYRQTGYGGFTSVGVYNLYIWNEDFVARKNNISITQAHRVLQGSLPEGFDNFPVPLQVKIYKQRAFTLLKQSWMYKLIRLPLWAGKTLLGTNHVHFTRLLLGRTDEPQLTLNQTAALPRPWLSSAAEKIIFALALLQVMGVVLCGAYGGWICWKKYPIPTVFLVVYTVYFWGTGSGFLGAYARFRAPFEFVLCIMAGCAASTLSARWKKQTYKPLP